MDDKPFLVFNLIDLEEHLIPEIKRLTKSDFDIEAVISTAGDLKYLNQITKIIAGLFNEPSDDFVKMITSEVYSGVKTQKVLEQFTDLTKRAMQQFLKDKVNDRISIALDGNERESVEGDLAEEEVQEFEENNDSKTVITAEAIDGFNIVKAILRSVLPVERISHRDTQSYFGILLDDNNRKPLCRLHLNAVQKYIGIIDESKKELRHKIANLDAIYDFSDELLRVAQRYEQNA